MYVEKLFPYLKDGDFVRSERKVVDISSIYCPLESDIATVGIDIKRTNRDFKLIKILPCDLLVFDESDEVAFKVTNGLYGDTISAVISEIDYTSISNRLDISTVDDVLSATMMMNGAYYKEDIITDEFINICSNGVNIPEDVLSSVKIKYENGISFSEWVDNFTGIKESADMLDSLVADKKSGKSINTQVLSDDRDSIYNWMDAYFALPEGEDMRSGGREVVPLLIGPTAVFKSATVKELCKKYDYRMVDFRVAFTSRLDYSGLYEMGEIEGDTKKYSYSCPMEEIVTCSDGFREFCRQSYDKISDILRKGYIEDNKVTDGENSDSNQTTLTDEQRDKLSKLLAQYKEYMKTPVLFFDEITRCKDGGVNGILVQLLNQKRFQNMTLNGCKFVAATNLNISNDAEHARLKYELDDMYDVAEDIDVAYSNRFIPLKVFPQDVKGRWFEWAESTTERNGKTVTSIHPVVLEFLKGPGDNLVYNDTPVLTAIDNGLSKNEINSQTFPNYRTWDMLSGYLYSIDEDYEVRVKRDSNAVREYRTNIVNGLISSWAGEKFINFLNKKGYKEYEEVHGVINDDVGDFLNSTLSSGTPALLIGPSSLGKTSRVNAYRKKVEKRTGLKPELISVNLASMDTADLMGYPIKRSLVEYSAGEDLEKFGLGSVKKELEDVIKGVASNLDYGMTDSLTVRAPSMEMKLRFQKALKEGREVILFFDEANRVKNPTIMSAMFECFTEDTPVRLLDGRTLTMSELYKEAESGNVDLWTYSVDNDGKVVPGHISCVIKKKPKTKMVRISMEDGSTVECTEDHKFMLTDGSYVMAKDLTDDMDIMEVDSRISDKDNGDTVSGYETALNSMKISKVEYIDTVDTVYDLTIDNEYHNFTLGNGAVVHNCISDSRFCGISFKDQKDKVKIVAACNMSYTGMEEGEDVDADAYSSAGSLDPALAARFSLFWKKGYDENDVKSWISFMEDLKKEGEIDSTLVDYFKTLDTETAVKTMARVEARKIESAEPSTRTFLQLSKDIKSMRGKAGKNGYQKSLFNGKVIFDSGLSNELYTVDSEGENSNISTEVFSQKVVDFLKNVLEFRDVWEPALIGDKIDVGGGRIMAGVDIMDTLEKIREIIQDYLSKPMTQNDRDDCRAYASTALDLASAANRLDLRVSAKRKECFAFYVGEDFAKGFLDYFNSVFGTDADQDITIEMLSDESLIAPFLRKKRLSLIRLSGDTDKMVDVMLDLMREFLSVHGETLPSKNYASFINGIRGILPVADNMSTLLIRSDKSVDPMFKKAEEEGDGFIKGLVSCYSASISDKDIDDMRNLMSGNSNSKSTGSKRKSRIL